MDGTFRSPRQCTILRERYTNTAEYAGEVPVALIARLRVATCGSEKLHCLDARSEYEDRLLTVDKYGLDHGSTRL